jgi:hypothetical protein
MALGLMPRHIPISSYYFDYKHNQKRSVGEIDYKVEGGGSFAKSVDHLHVLLAKAQ